MAQTITVTHLAGSNTARRTTLPEFTVGTPILTRGNQSFVYVGPATNAITAAAACTVTAAFVVNNTAGTYTADDAFAINEYGWVRKTASPF